ncbi:MAG: hypothetical protein HY800_08735 [Ignavibacteriales bacterium]|nr:hypothetical protein [Ignavibacteriales bacterium]
MEQLTKFEVKIYYSGFCTYEVEAKNEDEAILEARKLSINKKEISSNLQNWNDADTANRI